MFRLSVFLCFLALAYSSNVVDLTPENFDTVVDGSKHVFVEFFAPWCGHCKALAPAYEEVGDAFAKESSVAIAKIDCDAHKDTCSRFAVQGYPTLKFFKKGNKATPQDYNGGRDASDIVDYVNREAGTHARVVKPASAVTVLTPDTFDSVVLDESKDVLVEFYAPWCGHCKRLTPIWEKLANVYKNENGVVVANVDADKYKDLGSRFGVSGFPTIKFFPKSNKKGEDYNGGRELNDFVQYLNRQSGTKRTESGLLDETVGRHDSLDALAKKFLAAKAADHDAIVAETEAEAKKLGDANAEWYAKFMKVISKRGADFVEKEKERVNKLLVGDAVESHKQDEFVVRRNILNAFSA
eukprot:TRINITY_DN1610_c0_g2_i1.p1 TRINITY_DN1610_c0_g2~~TRINITY_DN1610_c0_g2_i1.p1  ORF type:complete len:353 (-),score=95.49 TRINITY_DN1610_c0_g2_i1:86-1144(-)